MTSLVEWTDFLGLPTFCSLGALLALPLPFPLPCRFCSWEHTLAMQQVWIILWFSVSLALVELLGTQANRSESGVVKALTLYTQYLANALRVEGIQLLINELCIHEDVLVQWIVSVSKLHVLVKTCCICRLILLNEWLEAARSEIQVY